MILKSLLKGAIMIKVTAALIEKDGKFLIARRRRGEHLEFKWEFPGGKIEDDETPEECLARELAEEFGIKVAVKDFICSSKYVYSHIAIDLLAYRVEYVSGEFRLSDHDQIQWVSPDELAYYDLAEADKPVAYELKILQGKH